MPDTDSTVNIREAGEQDLHDLYRLAAGSLHLDSFSEALLAEKLFPHAEGPHRARIYVAEAAGRLQGMMQSIWRVEQRRGWLGIFVVDEACRRRGVGRALLRRIRADWDELRLEEAEVLAVPGNYFTPGLDPRYTEAVCFLERGGFQRFKDCVNLVADLTLPLDCTPDEQRLRSRGFEVRRAEPGDAAALDDFFAEQFGADWRHETELALRNEPPALHLALRDRRVVAFSAHSTQNREWGFFGPMGTTPDARGTGLGRVLLLRCLQDLRDAGHRTAVIPWVGPIPFYAHHADCRVDRVFWRYRIQLAGDAA